MKKVLAIFGLLIFFYHAASAAPVPVWWWERNVGAFGSQVTVGGKGMASNPLGSDTKINQSASTQPPVVYLDVPTLVPTSNVVTGTPLVGDLKASSITLVPFTPALGRPGTYSYTVTNVGTTSRVFSLASRVSEFHVVNGATTINFPICGAVPVGGSCIVGATKTISTIPGSSIGPETHTSVATAVTLPPNASITITQAVVYPNANFDTYVCSPCFISAGVTLTPADGYSDATPGDNSAVICHRFVPNGGWSEKCF